MLKTSSGLQYEILEVGTGEMPTADSTVTVHYTGTLTDGTEFDSSRSRGEPIQFPLNGVIAGWTEGLQLMREGGRFKFYIPPHLGYGERGAPPAIPPNADLVFDVELLKIAAEPEDNAQIAAFINRGIPAPTCGAMPTATGSEDAAALAALHDAGNTWQNCMASFVKTTLLETQAALGELQKIDASLVPQSQRDSVNAYLRDVTQNLSAAEEALGQYKGIGKAS